MGLLRKPMVVSPPKQELLKWRIGEGVEVMEVAMVAGVLVDPGVPLIELVEALLEAARRAATVVGAGCGVPVVESS